MRKGKELRAGVSIVSALETAYRAAAPLLVTPDLPRDTGQAIHPSGPHSPTCATRRPSQLRCAMVCGPFSKHRTGWEDGEGDSGEMLACVAHLDATFFPDDSEQTCVSPAPSSWRATLPSLPGRRPRALPLPPHRVGPAVPFSQETHTESLLGSAGSKLFSVPSREFRILPCLGGSV